MRRTDVFSTPSYISGFGMLERVGCSIYKIGCVLKLDCSKIKAIFGWKPIWRMIR